MFNQTINIRGPAQIRADGKVYVAPITDSFQLNEDAIATTDASATGDSFYKVGNTVAKSADPNQVGSGFLLDAYYNGTVFHSQFATVKMFFYLEDNYDVVRKQDNNLIFDVVIHVTPAGACDILHDQTLKRFDVNNGYRASVRGFCQWTLKVFKLEEPVEITWRMTVPTSDAGSQAYVITTVATMIVSSWYLTRASLTEDQMILNLDQFFEEQEELFEYDSSDSSLDILLDSPYVEIE